MLKKFSNIRWFTNLTPPQTEKLVLTEAYDPGKYCKYDTFNAIEVGKTKNIPLDYDGVIGVPISFINFWDYSQFQLIGKLHYDVGCEFTLGMPIVQGKRKYVRLLIRRR